MSLVVSSIPRSVITIIVNMREGFHKVELHKVTWEVPEKYKNLAGIGSGAYGQVYSLLMIT